MALTIGTAEGPRSRATEASRSNGIVEHDTQNVEPVPKLAVPLYRAQAERTVRISVEAFDWNCPRHIAPKFAEDEVARMTAPLRARIAELEAALARAPK